MYNGMVIYYSTSTMCMYNILCRYIIILILCNYISYVIYSMYTMCDMCVLVGLHAQATQGGLSDGNPAENRKLYTIWSEVNTVGALNGQ